MKPKEMAERLSVSVKTFQNWDRQGKFPAKRTVTNRRYYTEADYLKAIGQPKANRFGFDWFQQFCAKFGTEIVVVNNEQLSPEAEIVQDLISIIQVFSSRVDGLRKHQKKVSDDHDVNHLQN